MSRNFSNQLSGQIGEALVVSELGRRDIVATAFSGNVPDIDILADKNGNTTSIQVKAWKKGAVSFDAKRFLQITIENGKQEIKGIKTAVNRLPFYVFVKVGLKRGEDSFFVLDQLKLVSLIKQGYQSFLDLHGGVRPKNPETTHNSVTLQQLLPYEDNWAIILQELGE